MEMPKMGCVTHLVESPNARLKNSDLLRNLRQVQCKVTVVDQVLVST